MIRKGEEVNQLLFVNDICVRLGEEIPAVGRNLEGCVKRGN